MRTASLMVQIWSNETSKLHQGKFKLPVNLSKPFECFLKDIFILRNKGDFD